MCFESVGCEEHCFSVIPRPEKLLCAVYSVATAAETEAVLPEVYSSFKDVFDKDQAELLPPHRLYDCQIKLMPGGVLPSCRVYALSETETQYLREYLDKYQANGFIRPSKSPVALLLFFYPKCQ